MRAGLLRIYKELIQWRDDELRNGNMDKVRKIHDVIKRRRSL